MRTAPPLLAPVFRSDGQARVLSAILLGSDELSISDLAALSDLGYATVHKEVDRLVDAGIFVERRVGQARLVRSNADSPLTGPLREILLVATGPVVLLARELGDIPGVEAAFLYGSFAARMRGIEGPSPNDIDVMVVGEPPPEAVYDACSRVEVAVKRPVNPTIVTPTELRAAGGFLSQVRSEPTVPVIGEVAWN